MVYYPTGAEGGTWTHKPLRVLDFESSAFANFTTSALQILLYHIFFGIAIILCNLFLILCYCCKTIYKIKCRIVFNLHTTFNTKVFVFLAQKKQKRYRKLIFCFFWYQKPFCLIQYIHESYFVRMAKFALLHQ